MDMDDLQEQGDDLKVTWQDVAQVGHFEPEGCHLRIEIDQMGSQ